jgi:hypothetical protein
MIPTIIPNFYRMEKGLSDLWWQASVDDDQVLGHCGGDVGLYLCKMIFLVIWSLSTPYLQLEGLEI